MTTRNTTQYRESLLSRVALLRINGTVEENVNAVNEVLYVLDKLHRVSKKAVWEDAEVQQQSDWLLEQLLWCTRSMQILMTTTPDDIIQLDSGVRPDVVSVVLLQRGFVEAFLMYNHLFCTNVDSVEKNFRVDAWLYSGVLMRRKHLNHILEYAARRAYDDSLLEKLKMRLLASPYLATLSDEQQKQLLEEGNARLSKSWEEILHEVRVADHVLLAMGFSLLSVFEHPDAVELMGFGEGKVRTQMAIERLRRVCMEMKLYLAYLIKQVSVQHADTRKAYDELEENKRYMISFYSGLPD
jgi:hypothetical protein